MDKVYAIGLDYGTSSVRGLLIDARTGEQIAAATFDFPHGEQGVIVSSSDPHMARQHPEDDRQRPEDLHHDRRRGDGVREGHSGTRECQREAGDVEGAGDAGRQQGRREKEARGEQGGIVGAGEHGSGPGREECPETRGIV